MDEPADTPPAQPLPPLTRFTPVPRLVDRSNGWKPQVQRAFIEALADTGSVKAACRRVRRSTVGAYHLRRQPGAEEFAAAWDAAVDLGIRRIEDTAMDRALNGVEMPVYSYGKLVGTRTSYNDRLLMFMLRNRRPDRFAEGQAKGLNAVGKMELDRLKKQWRKEWEAEQAAARPDEDAVIKGINDKLESMKDRWWDHLSPRTRAAYEEYRRLEEEDKANGYDCFADPEHERYIPPRHGPGQDEDAMPQPWDGYFVGEVAEEEVEEIWPKMRTVRDEGWD